MTELGAYVERYDTNNRRRGLVALAAAVVGLFVATFGAVTFLIVDAGPNGAGGNATIPGLVVGCGLGLVVLGFWRGWQFAVRRGEVFTLYEGGFVHTFGGTTTVVPWQAIASVTNGGKNSFFARTFGNDVNCVVKLADGRNVTVTGFTEGACLLAYSLGQAAGRGTG